MRGLRPSVRLPSRTVPICVRLPMGRERPLRMASTPAMKVVATAPIPGRSTPSRPSAGAIALPFPVAISRPPDARDPVRTKCESYHTPATTTKSADLGLRGGDAPRAQEERECRRREFVVVARTEESAFDEVVMEDSRAREVLFRLERVEHQDPAVARESAVVEEAEGQVAHGRRG